MKTPKVIFHAILAILIFLPCILFGQTRFIENSFPVHRTTQATPIPGGWVMPLNIALCNNRNWVIKYDSSGTYQKYAEADSSGTHKFIIDDIIHLVSGALICAGTFVGYPYIYKMNSSGKILWQTSFPYHLNDSMGPINPIRAISSPDGSIYVLSKTYGILAKADSMGQMLWIKPISWVHDIAWTSKGLTATDNNGLAILDSGGNSIKAFYQITGGSNITELERGTKGKFYAMNVNNIFTLDSSFQVIDSFKFNGLGSDYTIKNYADDSGYYFAFKNTIKGFDIKGSLKWTYYLPMDCNVTGLSSNGDQLAVTGSTTTSAFIKTFDQHGNTSPINRDVSLLKIRPVNFSYHDSRYISYGEISGAVDILVQNTSGIKGERIDSMYLFYSGLVSGQYYTYADINLVAYHNLNLISGDTTTLRFSIKRLGPANMSDSIISLSFEVIVSSPNGKLDQNSLNDTIGYMINFAGIVNPLTGSHKINIFPNPAGRSLTIDNITSASKSISISDITGKIIMSFANPGNHLGIDISGLPTGIYFVKVLTGNGMQIEKFVKD